MKGGVNGIDGILRALEGVVPNSMLVLRTSVVRSLGGLRSLLGVTAV